MAPFVQRTIVAAVLLPALFFILSTGGLCVAVLSLVIQGLCWQEYASLRSPILVALTDDTSSPVITSSTSMIRASLLCSALCTVAAWHASPYHTVAYAPYLCIFATLVIPVMDLILPLARGAFPPSRRKAAPKGPTDLRSPVIAMVMDSFVLVCIVGGLTSVIPLNGRVSAGEEEIGFSLTLFAFLTPWVADTAALFVGSRFGCRPIVPSLSPKKTLEGFTAMIPGALLITICLKFVSNYWHFRALALYRTLSLAHMCVLTVGAAIAAAIGDLVESGMKRLADVKDTGTLFGPHGGAIDRVDSIIPVMLMLNLLL